MRRIRLRVSQMLLTWLLFMSLLLHRNAFSQSAAKVSPEFSNTWKNYISFVLKYNLYLPFKADNAFSSPWTVARSMEAFYHISNGQTRFELKNVFGFPDSLYYSGLDYSAMQSHADTAIFHNVPFVMARSLWVDSRYKMPGKLKKRILEKFASQVFKVNMHSKPEEFRKRFHAWEAQYFKAGDTLATPVTMLAGTEGFLVHLITSFDVIWQRAFSDSLTQQDIFFIDVRKQALRNVEYMCAVDSFYYTSHNGGQIIELPLRNNTFSMIVILPKYADEFRKVEKNITLEHYIKTRRPAQKTLVYLRLPRFRIESRYLLKDVLQKLGVPTLFSADATFSGAQSNSSIRVSEIIQTSRISVGYQGDTPPNSLRPEDVESLDGVEYFNADHPFIFYIRENKNNTILCYGRVFKPIQD